MVRFIVLATFLAAAACGDSTPDQPSFECDAPEACDPAATCKKEGGVDVCRCPVGYVDTNGDGTLCTDVDECAAGTDECDIRASCTNTEGGYVCTCPAGFYGGGRTCTDVNECASGEHDCVLPKVCVNVPGTWECRCEEGFTGDLCDTCEAGYTPGTDSIGNLTCTPIPIDCSSDPYTCGDGGVCITDAGGDYCDCNVGHQGHICGRCAAGYQDNDYDGRCQVSCFAAEVVCDTNMVCSDATGSVTCVCSEGYAGVQCDSCASGWADVAGDGVCQAVTCAAAGLIDCGDHARCFDQMYPPSCECDIGYQGAGCTQCAPTHTNDGLGGCLLDLDAGRFLLAPGIDELRGPVIAAIDLTSWAYYPALPLSQVLRGLAVEPVSGRMFGLDSEELGFDHYVRELDPATGSVIGTTASMTSYHRANCLAYDTSRDVLYVAASTGASLYHLTVNPSGGYSSGSGSFDGSNADWAYDATNDELLAVRGGPSPTWFSFAADTGTNVSQATLTSTGLLAPGIAFHSSSADPFVVGQQPGTEEEWAEEQCRLLAAAHGYVLDDYAAVVDYDGYDGTEVTISSVGTGTTMYSHGAYGNSTDPVTTVQVATTGAGDVVCLFSDEEPLHVVVQAGARFRLLFLANNEGTVTLEIESGFVPETASFPPIRAYIGYEPVDPSIANPDQPVHLYTGSQWSQLGFTSWAYDMQLVQRPVAGTLDMSTDEATYHVLEGVAFTGGLTSF